MQHKRINLFWLPVFTESATIFIFIWQTGFDFYFANWVAPYFLSLFNSAKKDWIR